MTIGVVGVGLIGGSIGLACRGNSHRVIGFEPFEPLTAFERGCVDELGSLEEVSQSDIVFLCVPPAHIVEVSREVCRTKPSATVVTDCGSIKGPIVEWLSSAGEGRYVPGHPMAGHEKSGAKFASAWMFRGAKWILTPCDFTEPESIKVVEKIVKEMGAVPVRVDAGRHDREVAVLSHLPHVLAAVLIRMGGKLDSTEASAGSWKDLTRVGGVDPNLWTQILMANRTEIAKVLADEGGVQAFFKEAQRAKEGKK
jgi:prephenate dehydrogenase